jgi:hypothetical protein
MAELDSLHSSHRERLVEHVPVNEVLRILWRAGAHEVDVLRFETDAAGYDIVVEAGRNIHAQGQKMVWAR